MEPSPALIPTSHPTVIFVGIGAHFCKNCSIELNLDPRESSMGRDRAIDKFVVENMEY